MTTRTVQSNAYKPARGSRAILVVKALVFVLGTVLFTGGIFVAGWWLTGPGNVMADQVRIGPIDVSGRTQASAREAILAEVDRLSDTTVPIELADDPPEAVADDVATSAEPTLQTLGVESAVDAAVERAWQVGRSGDFQADLDARIRSFSDAWLIVALPVTSDERAVDAEAERIAESMSWETLESDVEIDSSEPTARITDGYAGGDVNAEALATELSATVARTVDAWQDTWMAEDQPSDAAAAADAAAESELDTIQIAAEEVPQEVTTEQVSEIAADVETYWDGEYEFLEPEIDDGEVDDDPYVGDSVPDDATVLASLLPSTIASMISIDITADDPISFNEDQLIDWIERSAGSDEPEDVWATEPENASVTNVSASFPEPDRDDPGSTEGFSASGEVEPSTEGWAFDSEALVELVTEPTDPDERVRTLPFSVVEPDVSSEDVEPMTEPTAIGSFTTFYNPGEQRNINIQRFAELVNGAQIAPGGELELNDRVGERTEENGFVGGGAIEDGEFVEQIGGGVSQFATTFYNAAFWAGADLLEWQPHSYYIDRYPMGRESTINYGTIDVRVRNPSDTPIFVMTDWTDDSVTVTFFGEPFADVAFETGEPTNHVSGSARDGFDIEYFRTRTFLDSGEVDEERFFHRYQPEN